MYHIFCVSSFILLACTAFSQTVELKDTLIEQPIAESKQTQSISDYQIQQMKLQQKIELLQRDTSSLGKEILDLKEENTGLKTELQRFKNGVFFGLGFGFNYFVNSPPKYYVTSDSTIGEYGSESGLSFILSGFMAYKVNEKHSLIFNVPLSDVTNREEYKIGLFNQKMAGGLGYGRNLGNVSLIFIMNVSPYNVLERELLEEEKFQYEKYSLVNPSDYPNTTKYSPSFTLGFSYNFQPGNANSPFMSF